MIRVVETRSKLEVDHVRFHRIIEWGSLGADFGEFAEMVVEDTMNGLLEEGADGLLGAGHYERTADREVYLAGHYNGSLQ